MALELELQVKDLLGVMVQAVVIRMPAAAVALENQEVQTLLWTAVTVDHHS